MLDYGYGTNWNNQNEITTAKRVSKSLTAMVSPVCSALLVRLFI